MSELIEPVTTAETLVASAEDMALPEGNSV